MVSIGFQIGLEAGDGFFIAVIDVLGAVCNELDILVVVEYDFVAVFFYCDGIGIIRNRGVALNLYRALGYLVSKRLAINCFVWCDLIIRSVPIVVYGVSEVGEQHPRAGEFYIFARHGEAAFGNVCVGC